MWLAATHSVLYSLVFTLTKFKYFNFFFLFFKLDKQIIMSSSWGTKKIMLPILQCMIMRMMMMTMMLGCLAVFLHNQYQLHSKPGLLHGLKLTHNKLGVNFIYDSHCKCCCCCCCYASGAGLPVVECICLICLWACCSFVMHITLDMPPWRHGAKKWAKTLGQVFCWNWVFWIFIRKRTIYLRLEVILP